MKAVSKGGQLMGWTSPGQGGGMKDWRTAQLTSQGLRATLEGEPHRNHVGKEKEGKGHGEGEGWMSDSRGGAFRGDGRL